MLAFRDLQVGDTGCSREITLPLPVQVHVSRAGCSAEKRARSGRELERMPLEFHGSRLEPSLGPPSDLLLFAHSDTPIGELSCFLSHVIRTVAFGEAEQ